MLRGLIGADLQLPAAVHFSVVRRNIMAIAEEIAPHIEGLNRAAIKTRLNQKCREVLPALATGREVIDG